MPKRNAQMTLAPASIPQQELVDVPLDELLSGPKALRIVGPAPDHSFIESVRQWGVRTPIALRQLPRGKYGMVDGWRRLRAVAVLRGSEPPDDWTLSPQEWRDQWDSIAAFVVKTDGWHPEVLPVILNHQRSDNFAVTLSSIEQLVSDGYSERDVYEATGVPIATIRRLMNLTNLHPELKAAWVEGKIVANVAIAASKCTEPQQAELVKVYRSEEQLTAADVREVKRAGQREAQQALEGLGDDDPAGAWRDEVARKLRECVALVPDAEDELRGDLRTLIDHVDRVAAPLEPGL
jgi:ParB-like chromosome segregation protein Spo0J